MGRYGGRRRFEACVSGRPCERSMIAQLVWRRLWYRGTLSFMGSFVDRLMWLISLRTN